MALDLLADVSAFDPSLPIAEAWTPPSRWYTDPEFGALEARSVWRSTWQPVARLTQLAQAGDYVAGVFAGEPFVVVRDQEGQLQAFYNTCRHKGREVVTGCGRAERLVCGYHAWAYDLDGTLRKAPKMAGIRDFDRAQMSLVPLRVEAWGHWAFICRDAEASSLAEQLGPLTDELDLGGWKTLTFVGRRSWDIACNWKVYADNYLDGGYHIAHMHPTLDAQLDMARYRTECFERYSIQTCPPATEQDARVDYDVAERIGERAVYAWLYPNFMLNRYGPCLDTNRIVPLGPQRCRVEYEFYFADPSATAFVQESMAQSDVTQREDIAICESVQRGLVSESYDRGRYAPELEIGEHHFHCLLHADYLMGLGA